MPTGYTCGVVEGEITEFSDFAMRCARAFGALINMRDDPMDAPIPTEMLPQTKWHDDRIAADLKRMSEVEAMTLAAADTEALETHRQALAFHAKELADKEVVTSRLNAMLAKVRAWQPPTPEHDGMKEFMIEQLTSSLPGDYAPSIPALLDGATWRQQEIDRLADSVVYHQKELDKEIERTRGKVEWVKALRSSLTSGKGNQ